MRQLFPRYNTKRTDVIAVGLLNCYVYQIFTPLSISRATFKFPSTNIDTTGSYANKKGTSALHHSESPSSSSSVGMNGESSDVLGSVPSAFLFPRWSSLTVRMRTSMPSMVVSFRGVEENHRGLLGTQQRSGWR